MDQSCAICKNAIDGNNEIISNKGQRKVANYYHLAKFEEGSNLVHRCDIRMHFTFDHGGLTAELCKNCFGIAIREMIEAGRI